MQIQLKVVNIGLQRQNSMMPDPLEIHLNDINIDVDVPLYDDLAQFMWQMIQENCDFPREKRIFKEGQYQTCLTKLKSGYLLTAKSLDFTYRLYFDLVNISVNGKLVVENISIHVKKRDVVKDYYPQNTMHLVEQLYQTPISELWLMLRFALETEFAGEDLEEEAFYILSPDDGDDRNFRSQLVHQSEHYVLSAQMDEESFSFEASFDIR